MADATRRAVLDVLAHGLRGDLAHSAVGVELGAILQAGTAADVYAGHQCTRRRRPADIGGRPR